MARKNNLEPQYGAIHSDGKNIDLLIGYLLFQNGFIQKAMEYFKFVEDIGSDNSLILECKQRIHSIIENCYSNI